MSLWLQPRPSQVTLLSFLVDIEVTFLDYIKGGWVSDHTATPSHRGCTVNESWHAECASPCLLNNPVVTGCLHCTNDNDASVRRNQMEKWTFACEGTQAKGLIWPEVAETEVRLWSVWVSACACACVHVCFSGVLTMCTQAGCKCSPTHSAFIRVTEGETVKTEKCASNLWKNMSSLCFSDRAALFFLLVLLAFFFSTKQFFCFAFILGGSLKFKIRLLFFHVLVTHSEENKWLLPLVVSFLEDRRFKVLLYLTRPSNVLNPAFPSVGTSLSTLKNVQFDRRKKDLCAQSDYILSFNATKVSFEKGYLNFRLHRYSLKAPHIHSLAFVLSETVLKVHVIQPAQH